MKPALTLKQRRFVKHYVETGNGTQSALVAYGTASPAVAATIASENLRKPKVVQAVAVALETAGLTAEQLGAVHAELLALYRSPNAAEKRIALRALDLAYRVSGAYQRRPFFESSNDLLDAMTPPEMDHFVDSGEIPERLRERIPPTWTSARFGSAAEVSPSQARSAVVCVESHQGRTGPASSQDTPQSSAGTAVAKIRVDVCADVAMGNPVPTRDQSPLTYAQVGSVRVPVRMIRRTSPLR
jgi:hypothetical protein